MIPPIMTMSLINIHDEPAIRSLLSELKINPHLMRPLRNAFYKKSRCAAVALETIRDLAQRSTLANRIEFHAIELVDRLDSQIDGASKLIFKRSSDEPNDRSGFFESVILRNDTGRTTLCVSSQIGCAAGCTFCATGDMGLTANLTTSEILDQVIHANRVLQPEERRVRNVVFMGMGEPFHNYEHVTDAVEVLRSPHCFYLEERRINVSTVGLPNEMLRFGKTYPNVGMALSLHSVDPDTRAELIPLAHRHSLESLQTVLRELAQLQSRPPMIEYLMLGDLTDRIEDARSLVNFLSGIGSHVNLIPYNVSDARMQFRASSKDQIQRFATILRNNGLTVTIRYSMGDDIGGACGQLIQREQTAPSKK